MTTELHERLYEMALPIIDAAIAKAVAGERERIRAELSSRQAVLAYVATGHLVDAVLWRDVADVLQPEGGAS